MAISQNFPTSRPSLSLNFARSKILDPRITFERSSSATYVDENGIIQTAGTDVARFDHNPATGESLGLLIEESRTNYHLNYSNNLFQMFYSNWTSDSSITYPNGGTVGGYNTFNQLSGARFFLDYNPAGNNTYTCSVYARLKPGSTVTTVYITVKDYQTDTARGFSSVVTLTSQWKRITATGTTGGATAGLRFEISTNTSGSSSQVYLWGAQVEVGSFPTSYIPTSGSTVTRSADTAQITGTNLTNFYNFTEGTFITEASHISIPSDYSFRRIFSIHDSATQSSDVVCFDTLSGNVRGIVLDDGLVSLSKTLVPNSGFNKYALSYKQNDFATTINGQTPQISNSGTVPTGMNIMGIGQSNSATNKMSGNIKSIIYYPTRLTNAQLQELTK